ncbi:glycosyltransferase family 61 protein [Halorubrum amylolyticum]|uniref:glycosyltransferase family 61 protein n=1 Tax=Halorubrum amylolyticum TaxID=2508724 RepID=UPI0013E8C95F|nr:glycosyltransferase family 61 protein [Halorubrum amylolyticum]
MARKKVFYPFFRRFVDSGRPEIVSARDVCGDEAVVEAVDDYNNTSGQSGVYTVSVETGYILSETGVALTNDGAFVAESLSAPGSRQHKLAVALSRHAFFDGPRFACNLVRAQIEEVDRRAESVQTICSLIPRYQNYYHWTVETLPKLRSIREYERATDEAVMFLIPDELPAWMEEPLSYLGVNRSETIRADASAYRASELVVPSFPRPTRRDCQWVRERVLESVTSQDIDVSPGSNVYISRGDTQERRVLNEGAVVDTLSKYGFESYRLADYSVAEQAVLFNEADLVVGAHGAGFSNLIYAEDTAVLELFGEKVKPNYAKLAESVGLPYKSLECRPRGVDLQVDTEQLATVVEELLSRN